jgi:FkbH-like protein
MRQLLQYPFDAGEILRRRKTLKAGLSTEPPPIEKRIAVLGGSTTAELRELLELFLLAAGIRPRFYESQFNRFFEDATVDSAALEAFAPDVVVVHTTWRDIHSWPAAGESPERCRACLDRELERFEAVWRRLLSSCGCLVVQNNFDPPGLELVGPSGGVMPYGPAAFACSLNAGFAAFAQREPRLLLNDIARLAARVGLDSWADPRHWHAWRMAVTPRGAVWLAHQTARIIRAAFGRTRKCLVLDLDNTLWGGVIGDDGVAGLTLGPEHPEGEAFVDFQRYCLALKQRGVLLAVCSKNDLEVARQGFTHPDTVLREADFSAFVANWQPKPDNLRAIARELNLGLDSLVFVDDSPFERELVARTLPEVAVAKVDEVSRFAEVLDREGWFDVLQLTEADLERTGAYAAERRRAEVQAAFSSYDDYLASLQMRAEIAPFSVLYLDRITQLTNKTNQFNLTGRRYSLAELAAIAQHPEYVTLYGRLSDRFGDHGLVSVMVGRVLGEALHLELWAMSCRVLKRTFEHAMFAALHAAAAARGLTRIVGTHVPTGKNGLVAGLYPELGFRAEGDGTFVLELSATPPRSTPYIERS